MGHRFDPSSRVHGWFMTGLPVSSQELVHVTPAKAGATWILERRAQREAGFTEQRLPPSLGSERITGWCHLGPTWFCGIDYVLYMYYHLDLELVHVTPAKAGATWILERRAQREAGFTEQRLPPTLGSERITGRCHLGPTWLCGAKERAEIRGGDKRKRQCDSGSGRENLGVNLRGRAKERRGG
ncbi:hypothetical protein QYF36_000409 [Acer negundo]|nr:hypothetical protein QYF36_000409 [Acer negundo]